MNPDRIKHLEFIHATIARQASHSFAMKGWAITVLGAIYAYAVANDNWIIPLVSVFPVMAFAWLDAFYLRQERLFRELYNDAIKPTPEVTLFSMSTQKYTDDENTYERCTYNSVLKSESWWMLYGMLFVILMITGIIAAIQGGGSEVAAECVRSAFK